jgi:hypothetical protein
VEQNPAANPDDPRDLTLANLPLPGSAGDFCPVRKLVVVDVADVIARLTPSFCGLHFFWLPMRVSGGGRGCDISIRPDPRDGEPHGGSSAESSRRRVAFQVAWHRPWRDAKQKLNISEVLLTPLSGGRFFEAFCGQVFRGGEIHFFRFGVGFRRRSHIAEESPGRNIVDLFRSHEILECDYKNYVCDFYFIMN